MCISKTKATILSFTDAMYLT